MKMKRHHLRGKRAVKRNQSSCVRQRSSNQHEAERQKNDGLEKIVDHNGPKSAQRGIHQHQCSRRHNGVDHRKAASGRNHQAKSVKDGRAHVYRPLIERQEASRSEIRHLAHRFFKNSHEMLVLNILEDQGIEADELQRLRGLLEASQEEVKTR